MNSKRVTIVFMGLSIENTPKLKLVSKTLEANGFEVSIKGIVKTSANPEPQPGLYVKGNAQGLAKVFKVFVLQLRLMLHLVFKDRSDFLYSVNTLSGWVVMIVSRLKGKKYVYEAHEMVFGVNYPFFKGSWRKIWIFIEKRIIRRSTWFFTTDQFRLTFYNRFLKLKKQNQGYLLNVPNSMEFEDKSVLREKYGIRSRYIVSYCGGLMRGRNIEEIIEAYGLIDRSETTLLLAGSVSEDYKNELLACIKRCGIAEDEVIFTGFIENRILKEYMRLSDVTFILYQPDSLNNRFSSPNKVFDAIHTETYFITSYSPLSHLIVSQFPAGEIIQRVTPVSIRDHLVKALEHVSKEGSRDYSALKKAYSWEEESRKIERILPDLIP
jgi:glycosyltransferase involved in cell wall biosynthesis